MKPKFGICKECEKNKPLNSRGICPECVFAANHNGQNRQEYYLSRSKGKGLDEDDLERIRKDEETYEQVFNEQPPFCLNCRRKLNTIFRDEKGKIIARYQYSHIFTKKAYPEFRNNPKNFNRLCFFCHNQWEFGDRSEMRILPINEEIKEQLLKEKFGE